MATTGGAREALAGRSQAFALTGLLTGAAISLTRVYVGNSWWWPTVLTIVSAVGLSALLRRTGAGALIWTLGMLAGFVLVASWLLFSDTLFYLLPGTRTLSAARRAVIAAAHGVTDEAAPVEPSQAFLLLTCAGVWAVAMVSDALTFRARQPLLAIVPALGLFLFPAIIRPSSPAWYTFWFLLGAAPVLLVEGHERLAGWGGWVFNPANRSRWGDWGRDHLPGAATARTLAVIAGLLAVAVPWVLPGYGQTPLLELHGQGAGSVGGGIAINPFVSLRTNLNARGDAHLFSVDANSPRYWRLVTLDRFDGTSWTFSGSATDTQFFNNGEPSLDFDGSAPTTQLTQTFHIDRLSGTWLPAAAAPVRVVGKRQFFQHRTNLGITTAKKVREGFSYTAVSQILDDTKVIPKLHTAGPVEDLALARYLDATAADVAVADIASAWTRTAKTPYEKALAIQDHLRSGEFKYSLDVPALSSGSDQLVRFLTVVKRGYCEQFASSMAVLARLSGIPARVAVGFTQGVPTETGYSVSTIDAHAWPELYFTGVGWVRFEPTPRSDQTVLVPFYTTPIGRNDTGDTTAGNTNLQGSQQDRTANRTLTRAERNNLPQGSGAAVRKGTGSAIAANPVFWLVAVVLLAAIFALAGKAGRRIKRRRRAKGDPRLGVLEAYAAFSDWTADAGIARKPAETPTSYARRLVAKYGDDATPVADLSARYLAAAYGAAPVSEDEARGAQALSREARQRLAIRLTWPRRIAAMLSIRSLVPQHLVDRSFGPRRRDGDAATTSLRARRLPVAVRRPAGAGRP